MNKMPTTKVLQEEIDSLPPKVLDAIRYYTDPLLPTYDNKAQSAMAAGYAEATAYGNNPLSSPKAKKVIARIRRERREAGGEVEEYMHDHVFDAARELIKQLSAGRELEIRDPGDILDQTVVGEMDLERARQITQHNRIALSAVRERRKALELVLAYVMGGPEQRQKTIHKTEKHVNLDDLSDGELKSAIQLLSQMQKENPDPIEVTVDDEEVEASFEVVDDD